MEDKNLKEVVQESLEKQREQAGGSAGKEILSWMLIIAVAIGAALLLNRFIIVNAQVTSGSMSNTIHTWDRVLGLRVDYWFHGPERGDVIFFKNPDRESEIYVKRVIGLPGETVEIKGGVTYVNGEAMSPIWPKHRGIWILVPMMFRKDIISSWGITATIPRTAGILSIHM